MLAAIGDPDVCLINTLGRRQHRGEVNEYGRRGHIPGSRNVTAWEILDRDTRRYRPLPELRRKVASALEAKQVIIYCGAGAAASSLARVVVRLGSTAHGGYQFGGTCARRARDRIIRPKPRSGWLADGIDARTRG